MSSIFIKTAGYYFSIPGYYIGFPKPGTMVLKFVFCNMMSLFIFLIPTEFLILRNQLIGIIFVVIYLCRFKPNLIHSDIFSQFLYIFNLVFVWFHHKELKKHKRSFAF